RRRKRRSMHSIRTRPNAYYAGKTTNGRQILIGWLGNAIAIFQFDDQGALIDTKELPIDADLGEGLGPVVESKVENQILSICARLGFHDEVIHVAPFYSERLSAGIRQYPIDLEEFIHNPGEFANEDAAIFQADIADWNACENFILRWNEDHYLG